MQCFAPVLYLHLCCSDMSVLLEQAENRRQRAVSGLQVSTVMILCCSQLYLPDRSPYSENPADFKPLTTEEMAKIKEQTDSEFSTLTGRSQTNLTLFFVLTKFLLQLLLILSHRLSTSGASRSGCLLGREATEGPGEEAEDEREPEALGKRAGGSEELGLCGRALTTAGRPGDSQKTGLLRKVREDS